MAHFVLFLYLVFLLSFESRGQTARARPTVDEIRILLVPPQEQSPYKGKEGYLLFAERHFAGKMDTAARHAGEALSVRERGVLNWGPKYQGTTAEYRADRTRLLSEDGNLRFFGPEGYVKYADWFYEGNMQKTLQNVSAVLTEIETETLGWGSQYQGTTTEYHAERRRLLDPAVRQRFHGSEGYIGYADSYYGGNMFKAFINVSAVLTTQEREALNWGNAYQGTTAEYQAERIRLFHADGNPKFRGPEGYIGYADSYYGGNMFKAFINVSAVVTSAEKEAMGWGNLYHGTAAEYQVERSNLLDSGGKPRFTGIEGYVKYADLFHEGNMLKAFVNVSAVLTATERGLLHWGNAYQGTTVEYHAERKQLFDVDGRPRFAGPNGYLDYANQYYAGRMKIAFQNASAVLTDMEIKSLNWGNQYNGTTIEYQVERERLFDADGKPRFIGPGGYVSYADQFYQGKMLKAYQNVSAVLTDGEKVLMNWGNQYQGTTKEYQAERARLFDANGRPRFVGPEGYLKYASQYYPRSMQKAYANVSAVVTADEKAAMNWGNSYRGTTSDYRDLREFLFKEGVEKAVALWFGKLTGLNRLVDSYLYFLGMSKPFESNTVNKVRSNFRAIVTPEELRVLGWDSVSSVRSTARTVSPKKAVLRCFQIFAVP